MRALPPLVLLPLVVVALLAGARARAEEPIETDRPDVSEASTVVGLGRFQIETSLQSARDTSGGVTTRTLTTPTLLRYGISDTIELRAESDGLAREKTNDAGTDTMHRTHGIEDVAFGAKWRVREGDAGWLPGVAWLADVQTPSGSRSLRGAGFRPSIRVTAEWELPRDWTLGVMPGVFIDRNDRGKRFGAGILALTLGKALTPRWRSFVELAAERLASAQDGGSSLTVDTGFAFLATNDVQLDLAVSRGVTSAAPDFQAGLGLSARF